MAQKYDAITVQNKGGKSLYWTPLVRRGNTPAWPGDAAIIILVGDVIVPEGTVFGPLPGNASATFEVRVTNGSMQYANSPYNAVVTVRASEQQNQAYFNPSEVEQVAVTIGITGNAVINLGGDPSMRVLPNQSWNATSNATVNNLGDLAVAWTGVLTPHASLVGKLSALPLSGNLDPTNTDTVTFTLNPAGVATGVYNNLFQTTSVPDSGTNILGFNVEAAGPKASNLSGLVEYTRSGTPYSYNPGVVTYTGYAANKYTWSSGGYPGGAFYKFGVSVTLWDNGAPATMSLRHWFGMGGFTTRNIQPTFAFADGSFTVNEYWASFGGLTDVTVNISSV